MAGILITGAIGFKELPVSALPQVDYPTIQVLTFYPGASPDVMASAVTAPLERQFGQVPGLNQMTSNSSDGSSVITLQFVLNLNIDVAEQEVQAAINAAGSYLPADLPNPPIYSKTNPADAPILTLALTSTTVPLTQIEDFADTRFAQKISQLPGVGFVNISGGQKPAVRVQVNPTALSSYGLTMEDIRTAISQTNVNQAKGTFDGARQSYSIATNDQLLSSDQYKPIVVTYRNGAPVLLSDVATVVDSAENVRQAAWMNTTPAVILNIQRQPGANIIAVVDRVKSLLPQLSATLPAAVKVSILTDRTTTIRASVADVEFELILVIALVIMVIFLFLRTLSATIIPSIAVPISLIGTFGVMYLLGYSLNNLTLMALTISTGFVVDDAIVMIENITRYIEAGDKPLDAALKGAEQIGFTIVSLTLSLIAVLIPLLFMADIVGRLFREFAITLSVTILISAVVSLTLTPMMCAKLLKHKEEKDRGKFYRVSERLFNQIIELYGRTLTWVLRHQPTTLIVAVATLVVTVLLYIIVPKGFFPVQDTGVILGISEATQTASFGEMSERQQSLARVILKDPGVESLSSFIGIDGTNTTMNSGRIQINLKPLKERHHDSATDIIRRLQPELAKVAGTTLFLQPVQDLTVEDRVSRTQYQYSLEDPDPAELAAWTPKFVSRLQSLSDLRDVASDQQNAGLEARLILDRTTASRLGITPQMLDNALYDEFGQRQVSTMFTQLNQYHVILESQNDFQTGPNDLKNVFLRPAGASAGAASGAAVGTGPASAASNPGTTFNPLAPAGSSVASDNSGAAAGPTPAGTPGGGTVPLGAFTRVVTVNAPLSVNHQGQFPVVTVSFNLAPGASLGSAVKAIEKAKEDLGLPESIQGAFQGTAQAFRASLTNTPLLILAALVTVYILLGVLYESYIHPITIRAFDPAVGGSRRSSGPHALPERFLRDRLDRDHSADRHRQEERHHDGRFRDRRGAQPGKKAGRSYLPGVPPAFPPDHDDDDGRAPRRNSARARLRDRGGAAPAARHHDRRRPDLLAGSDVVHDAGDLPGLRQARAPDGGSPQRRGRAAGRFPSGRGMK